MLPRVRGRPLAAIAVAGQLAFVVAWAVAGALQTGYAPADQAVSDLAALTADNRWIVGLGLVCLAMSDTAVAILLWRALGPPGHPAAVMFAVAAVGVLSILALPLDCAPSGDPTCQARLDAGRVSTRHDAHGVAAVLTQLTLLATPFAVARALAPRRLALWAFAAGLAGLATLVWVAAIGSGEPGYGVAQRATFGFVHLWVVAIAAAVVAGWAQRDRVPEP